MKSATKAAPIPASAWERIIAEEDPTFGSEDFRKMQGARTDIMLFGQAGPDDEVITKLDAIIQAYWICDEDSFCETTGCPKDELDQWLAAKWTQHHALNVARLKETPGPFPLLLVRRRGLFSIIETYSRGVELMENAPTWNPVPIQ